MDCLFCKISSGEIKSEKVYEDENVIGIKDIHPVAKVHLLFMHKSHTKDINEMARTSADQFASIYKAIAKYTGENELEKNGFRVVSNLGRDGGQAILHTHFHVLGGQKLSFNP